MSERPASLAGGRDVVLVVAVAAFAFVLGAMAAGFGADGATPASGSAFSPSVSLAGSSKLDHGRVTRSGVPLSPADPNRGNSGANRPRLAPASIPEPNESPGPVLSGERFSGEGAGRRETVILRDPHNRRSYILETASLMHRRGWIGLEERIAGVTVDGSGNADRPAAQRGPQ